MILMLYSLLHLRIYGPEDSVSVGGYTHQRETIPLPCLSYTYRATIYPIFLPDTLISLMPNVVETESESIFHPSVIGDGENSSQVFILPPYLWQTQSYHQPTFSLQLQKLPAISIQCRCCGTCQFYQYQHYFHIYHLD